MSPGRIIIVADDDEDIRETIAAFLGEEGYETRTASDGREALLALDSLNGAPCVLLLDLMMPTMSGFEVLDVLSNLQRLAEVPVIVCSAVAAPSKLPNGIRQYLPKPISIDALLDGLHEICSDEPVGPSEEPAPARPSLEMG